MILCKRKKCLLGLLFHAILNHVVADQLFNVRRRAALTLPNAIVNQKLRSPS